jgi:hypothetical protein
LIQALEDVNGVDSGLDELDDVEEVDPDESGDEEEASASEDELGGWLAGYDESSRAATCSQSKKTKRPNYQPRPFFHCLLTSLILVTARSLPLEQKTTTSQPPCRRFTSTNRNPALLFVPYACIMHMTSYFSKRKNYEA